MRMMVELQDLRISEFKDWDLAISGLKDLCGRCSDIRRRYAPRTLAPIKSVNQPIMPLPNQPILKSSIPEILRFKDSARV